MENLPKDPDMLASSVNMLLRDNEFESLEDLCACYDHDLDELKDTLLANGYIFSEVQRQFKPLVCDE